ncbi:MAG TPA: CoA-transferase [Burkholderiales bacterium]|jgi:glutaconate CoA-transferase subunit B|nr:CoA-transferase [Burkholderiales bacterium]
MSSYAPEELLACAIARLIGDAAHVAVGAASPIPASACELLRAQNGGRPRLSLMHQRKANPYTEGSRELFDLAGQGRVDVFFLGGAQIDGEANINLVGTGEYPAVAARFPGSFGSGFMYFAAKRTILFREEHSKRVLVRRVDFISAPGWSPPEVWRRGGPQALVTGKAIFAWQKDARRFRLESVHPGHAVSDIRENTGFDFDCPANVPDTHAPSAAELALLRGVVATKIAENYPAFARRVWQN